MTEKTNRSGEGRNVTPQAPKPGRSDQQGIAHTERGEEQPADKARAQQVHKGPRESEGEKAQREAARQQPLWPGEPAGHE